MVSCSAHRPYTIRATHPLFGPFGTTNGRKIPTTPQITVKMIKGSAARAIVKFRFFLKK